MSAPDAVVAPAREPAAPARVARNAAVRSGGEALAKLGSLAFFVTMARELGTSGFGAFMFALALTNALIMGAAFGTDDLIARDVARDRTRAARMLGDVASVKALTATGLLAACVVIALLGDFPATTRAAVALVGLGVTVEVLCKSWYAIAQAYERMGIVSLSLATQRIATAAVGVAVLAAGGGVVAAAIVYAAGSLTGLALALGGVRRLGVHAARPRPRNWLPLLKAGAPIGIAGLLFLFLLRIDVTLLSFLSGPAEVGVYAAAYRLVEATQFLAWSYNAAMLPWLARAGRGAVPAAPMARGFELGLKVVLAGLLPVGLALVLFARPLISLLYGAGYEGAVAPLQLLGLGCALYGVHTFASTAFIAADAPGTFARLVAAVVAGNLAVNLVAIPRYGADGAAATALLSGAVLAVAGVALVRRRVGPLRLGRVLLGPLAAAAAMAAVALVLPAPFLPRAVAALAAYAAVLAAVEVRVHPDDVRACLRALPTRGARSSRSRSGRPPA